MNCVLCARKHRTRPVENGHVCQVCRNTLRVDLSQIPELVAIAATMPDPLASRPGSEGGRPHPGSRPPVEVARIDPELVLVRLDRDDPSSAVPLLVMLEDWERLVREERGLSPYGPVSAFRASRSARMPRVG